MAQAQPTWWAPVWRGLVDDPAGTHYRRLGLALWLHLHLIEHADRASGLVFCKLSTVSRTMGVPLGTVRGWMRRLRRNGYVVTEATGRALRVRILKWKPLPERSGANPQSDGIPSLRVMGPEHQW